MAEDLSKTNEKTLQSAYNLLEHTFLQNPAANCKLHNLYMPLVRIAYTS